MSGRVYLLGVGVALVALALAVTDWALSLQPGVTEANGRRIRPGMTLQEGEVILGGRGHVLLGTPDEEGSGQIIVWSGADGYVIIVTEYPFGENGPAIVSRVRFVPNANRPGPLAHLRAWLSW
jgi:hypothetical protein